MARRERRRAIARSLGTSPSTVGEYLRRAKVAGVSWPVPEALDDAGLERRLFRMLNAAAKYSRSTSRIFRMDSLLFASFYPCTAST